MANQLSKFIRGFADKTAPLRALLKKSVSWQWESSEQKAFESIKRMLTCAPTLIHYDLSRVTVVSADSSSYGLGAVLKQKVNEKFLSVAYAS